MKYVLIVDGQVREEYADNPNFHPDLDIRQVANSVQVGWVDNDGTLSAAGPRSPSADENRQVALRLLAKSDITILRCAEVGEAVPQEWIDYRAALRVIAGNGEGVLPERPSYP